MPKEEVVMESEGVEITQQVPTAHELKMKEIDENMKKMEAEAERIENANAEAKKLLMEAKQERLLAGKAGAGEQATKEETPQEYAKRVMAGDERKE